MVQITAQEQNEVNELRKDTQDQELKPETEIENDKENEKGRIEINPAYKLTPTIVIVQRVVDKISEKITESVTKSSDGKSFREESADSYDDPPTGPGTKAVDKQITAVNDTHSITTSKISEVSGSQRDAEVGDRSSKKTKDEGGREDTRNQIGRAEERRRGNVQTNGLNEEDGDGDGLAVLMGWTALVGVVGILAIAPAG